MLGKASTSVELLELPKEDIVDKTTNKPVSINIDQVKIFDLDKGQVNKTELILSKILNKKQNQQTGVKDEEVEDYEDLDEYYNTNKPFYFTKNTNRTWYQNKERSK